MPKLPPLKQVGLSIALDKLRIFVPAAVVLGLLVAFVPSVALLLVPRGQPQPVEHQPPRQDFTADMSAPLRISSVALGELPTSDDPRQYEAPCDSDFYVELKGKCWIPLDINPCPRGKAFEHKGKCYVRALRAERVPTSGDFQRSSVAGP